MAKIRTYWDYIVQDGRTYQMGAQSHRVYLLDLLQEKGVKSILDTGCGTGPIYKLIKETTAGDAGEGQTNFYRWSFKYKGTDYSEGMIEVCKKEFPEADFEVQDSRHLKEKNRSWDCVLIMHVLDHLDDYEAAIKQAARVAKKYVLIVLWRGINYNEGAENNLNDRNMLSKEPGEKPWEDTFLQEYSWEKLQKAFKKAKLTVVQKEDGEEINKEGRYNTLILLEK